MAYLDGNVTDQNEVPVEGALVYVYSGGSLADLEDSLGQPIQNPVTTGEDGYWQAYVADGYYTARYFWGGRQRYVEANVLAGTPPVGPNSDPNVRFDLASTDTGKGAALSGWKQTGTSSVARTVDARLKDLPVSPDDKGAKPGDNTFDSSTAIAAALKHFGEPAAITDLTGIGTISLKPGETYYVKGSIIVPVGVSIEGNGAFIEPHPDAVIGDFVGGFTFLVNRDTAGNQTIAGGGFPFPTYRNLRFNNLDSDGNVILSGWRGFDTKGRLGLENVQAHGLWQLVSKTASGSADNNYVDNIRIKDIYLRNSQGSDHVIDIDTQGDNLLIEGITTSQSAPNRNSIHVSRCQGGVISRVIGGNILLERCDAIVVEGYHPERGYIEGRGSNWTLRDSRLQHHKDSQQVLDPISGADLGFQCPIRHVRWSSSVYAGTLAIENVKCAVSQDGSFDESYAEVDTPDLLLETQGNASFTNFMRGFANSQLDGNLSAAKISRHSAGSSDAGAPAANWENVSHLAAKSGYYASNKIACLNNEAGIPASYAALSGTLSAGAVFDGASATYYYRVVILHGPKDRLVARTIAEFSASPTQGGNAVLVSGANTNAIARPGFTNTVMRVYRGTSAATYDKVVDIPVIDKLTFYDLGYFVSTGERWKSRTSGDIDTFNTSSTFSRIVTPDGVNCILHGTTTLPALGAWVAGDEFVGTGFKAIYDGSEWIIASGGYTNTDIGDASLTVPLNYGGYIRAHTPLTAARSVTLPVEHKGQVYIVERTAAATGAFDINVRNAGASLVQAISGAAVWRFTSTGSSWIPTQLA